MSFLKNFLLALTTASALSCVDPTTRNNETPAIPELLATSATSVIEADYNYFIQPLPGWGMFDTTAQGQSIRLLISPAEQFTDHPAGNIVTGKITGGNIDNFVQDNIDFLKNNGQNISIRDQGKMDVRGFDVRWFTYSREQDGSKRDMINYIIPAGEFAYFITFGSNSGSLETYRAGFDKMVATFRLPSKGQTREFEPKETGTSSIYLPTGIYFVTYEGQGIKRKIHQSSEEAWIEKKAFASAGNIARANLRHNGMDGNASASLNIQFDAKGTEDLAAGTGIYSQPKIAVVIANKLLYVVDNRSKITTGSLNILMEGFSVEELEGMRSAAVNGK